MTSEAILKIIFAHLTPSNVMLIVITTGIFKIYMKVRDFDNRVVAVEKRTGKMIQVMEGCPSISKATVAWLGDDRKNTRPPEKSLCQAAYKVEIKK